MVEARNRIQAVILDWNRTLVRGDDSPAVFYPDVPAALRDLKARKLAMGIVSAGGTNPAQRWREFVLLGLAELGVSEFQVVGPNEPKDLVPMFKKLGVKPEECIVAGDRISKEIEEGNKAGAVTVRIRRPGDKFSEDIPQNKDQEPDYTYNSLNGLAELIDQLNRET